MCVRVSVARGSRTNIYCLSVKTEKENPGTRMDQKERRGGMGEIYQKNEQRTSKQKKGTRRCERRWKGGKERHKDRMDSTKRREVVESRVEMELVVKSGE